MERFSQDGVEWLQFDLLSDIPRLRHAVFLRHGGHSKGPYHSLNMSYHVHDEKEDVKENVEKIKEILQVPKLVSAKQAHDKQIAHIVDTSLEEQIDYDALLTEIPNIGLMINHADCQATIFYDPKHRAIANVHVGWRGNLLNIYQETIHRMQSLFDSKPADLLVCISPSLGPDDAEFINYSQEFPEEFWSFQVRPTYFDLWALSEFQLQAAGVLHHHIEVARISTYSNPQDFFSYRRHKVTGRHGTCVTLI
jgi:YfiH family protein